MPISKPLFVLFLASALTGTALAQDPQPTGTYSVTLGCTGGVSLKNGSSYYGGRYAVRLVRNNNKTDDGETIPGVPARTVELLGYKPMSDEFDVVPMKEHNEKLYVSEKTDGPRVHVFRDSNCIKTGIVAVIISGNLLVSCPFPKDEKMTGLDFKFCR